MENSFIAAARRGNNSWQAYISTLFLVAGAFFVAQFPLAIVLKNIGQNEIAFTPAVNEKLGFPAFFALIMLQFLAALAMLLFCVRYIHQRSPMLLINPGQRFNTANFGFGVLLTLLISAISDLVMYGLKPEYFQYQFDPVRFFPFMLLALLLFPVQIGFEELFVRGYLMQAIGRSGSSLFALAVTALLFGLMHLGNNEVSAFGAFKMLSIYIIIGATVAAITLISEGLEIALGFHLVNNLYGSLVKTFPESALQTPALFIEPSPDPNEMVTGSLIMCAVLLAATMIRFRHKSFRRLIN